MSHIWGVGSIGYDLFGQAPHLPHPGETVAGHGFLTAPGGKGLNQAVAAARLGADVFMVGCVGDDAFGAEVMQFLRSEGIDLGKVVTVPGTHTGTALIFVADDGANAIVVVPGANGRVTARQAEALHLKAGDIVQLQFEIPMEANVALLRRAKTAGAISILNPSPIVEGAEAALALADILVLNEHELAKFSGQAVDPQGPYDAIADVARGLRRFDKQIIVVTLGARGAVAVIGEAEFVIPGIDVPVVDTTGAGDTFAGALAARLLAGDDLAAALRLANQAAALSVGKVGAAPSIPYLKDLVLDEGEGSEY